MERTLYHGSQIILEKPEYGKGARNNDYGRGFYCTEEIEPAREWACAKQTNGYVNQYKLNLEGLQVLNLNNGKYNILNWLALLAANRTYWLIIPVLSEPPVRTLRATIPENESQLNFLILIDNSICQNSACKGC